MQEWSSKLHDSGKARHYRYFMPNFGLASYIKFDLPLKFRISLSKLRCSAHNLIVETGRHSNLDYVNGICRLCNLNKIEDEFHFVMECPFYSDIRNNHLPKLLNTNMSLETFYTCFMDKKHFKISNLSSYIFYAFEHREMRV